MRLFNQNSDNQKGVACVMPHYWSEILVQWIWCNVRTYLLCQFLLLSIFICLRILEIDVKSAANIKKQLKAQRFQQDGSTDPVWSNF